MSMVNIFLSGPSGGRIGFVMPISINRTRILGKEDTPNYLFLDPLITMTVLENANELLFSVCSDVPITKEELIKMIKESKEKDFEIDFRLPGRFNCPDEI